jgi:hypothetical protein
LEKIMNTCKISLVNKSIMGLLIWLVLFTGLVAAQTSSGAGRLTLSLQPSLDSEGNIMATTITKAELLGTDGTVMVTGTTTGGTAQFNLSSIAPGDYFIRVNDLADDLVPTRIDDPSTAINEFVGQKLRVAVIGELYNPTYKIDTFSKGQGKQSVVGFSDGATLTPERYAYVILSLKTSPQKLEVRIIGSAAQINSYTPSMPNHPSTSTLTNPPFSKWIISETTILDTRRTFKSGHGYNYNGTDSNCNVCHVNMDTKPVTFSDVATTSGWCFRCHYGKGGADSGFIDTTVISTPLPTTAAPTARTAASTATPGAPAFEAFLAISALMVVILVRRR